MRPPAAGPSKVPLSVIRVAVGVGYPPAVLASECRECASAIAGYLSLHGLAVRLVEARGGVEVYVTDDAGTFAEAMLSAFRVWRAVALDTARPDHLQAFTTAGA